MTGPYDILQAVRISKNSTLPIESGFILGFCALSALSVFGAGFPAASRPKIAFTGAACLLESAGQASSPGRIATLSTRRQDSSNRQCRLGSCPVKPTAARNILPLWLHFLFGFSARVRLWENQP